MKLDIPIQLSGWACILENGEICFGETQVECNECEYKKENECAPVMIEIIPTNEWVDRQHSIESINTSHEAYKDALDRLKVDLTDLKKSLENVKMGDKND